MNIRYENINIHLYQKLDKMIEQHLFENKKIILFGLNATSYSTKFYLEKKGYKIYAYIDNDTRKVEQANEALNFYLPRHILHSQKLNALQSNLIPTYSPEDFLSSYHNNYIILISSKYYMEMKIQLEKLGYQESKDFYQVINFYAIKEYAHDIPENAAFLSTDELRTIYLEIMIHIKNICKEHNLRYYLCGGTLIGAIRHNGFIPWDDDVDMAMPLSDFKKLTAILEKDGRYVPISPYCTQNVYHALYMKVIDSNTKLQYWSYPYWASIGVHIDIFPLFGLPSDTSELNSFYNKMRILNNLAQTECTENIEYTEKFYKFREKILSMMEQYDFDKSENIGNILSKYKEKEIMPRRIYNQSIDVTFEGETFKAAAGYNEYLTRLFGDYMTPPNKTCQYTNHSFIAYRI